MQVLMAIEKTLEAVYKRMGIDIGTVSRTGPGQQLEPGQQVPELADMNVAGTDATVRKVLSYNTRAMSWNADWTRNAEEKYCYCGTNKQEPCVTCAMCKNWFHHSCTKAVPAEGDGYLPYQVNCKFTCAVCSESGESFELRPCSWIESVLGATGHLMWTTQRDMFKVVEIGDHLEKYWDILCHTRPLRENWRGPLNSYFTNNRDRCESSPSSITLRLPPV